MKPALHGQHIGEVSHHELPRALGTFQLWGIAVGLAISGEYFGWSFGWASAGTLGFLVTTVVVSVMYITFVFSLTELTSMIPHAGGPFAYTYHAFGPFWGYIAGLATLIEFLFAPPAIALAIGSYLKVPFPSLDPKLTAAGIYIVLMGLNIIGVRIAAAFELLVTVLAILELLLFVGVTAPEFSLANFAKGGWSGQEQWFPGSIPGMFEAIPFAIWFFLAIEGVAMASEEARNPKRAIPIAYSAGILTLVSLAIAVMFCTGGAGDWTRIAKINDPLPQAMKLIVGEDSALLNMLVWVGLFGLIASFHGIIIAYSRQLYAQARAGYLPSFLAAVHPRFRTPHLAILAGGAIGIAAIFSDNMIDLGGQGLTANILTMSVIGALLMYIVSMAALFRLRRIQPNVLRPYLTPFYPTFPTVALVIAFVSLLAIIWFNLLLAGIFAALLAAGYPYFHFTKHRREISPFDDLLEIVPETITADGAGPTK